KTSMAAAEAEGERIARDRAALAGAVAPDLLAEYERRSARGGIAVGLLRGGVCEGCRMVLAGTDLTEIRKAAPDEVVSCPECGAIRVRTAESGLRAAAGASPHDDVARVVSAGGRRPRTVRPGLADRRLRRSIRCIRGPGRTGARDRRRAARARQGAGAERG